MNKQQISQLKYVTLVNLLAIVAVAVTLGLVSIASLMQTISAFNGMADPSLPLIGVLLPIAYGVLFQYGQNAALYIRDYYCTSAPMLYVNRWAVTQKGIALWVFVVCAFVDAATNVLWFYRNTKATGDVFMDVLIMVIGYPCMVLIVFAEEVMGRVLQALRRVLNEYKSIKQREKASGVIDSDRTIFHPSPYAPTTTYPRSSISNAPRYIPPEPIYKNLNEDE